MIKLVEEYFRGMKRSKINEEMQNFCKEHSLQERDVRCIINRMYLPKRRKKIGFKTKYPSRRKSKVTARFKNNYEVLNNLVPKKQKERYHPVKRKRVWTFNNQTKKWTSIIVHDPDYIKETRFLKSSTQNSINQNLSNE